MRNAAVYGLAAGGWALLVVLSCCGIASRAEEPARKTTPEERQALEDKAKQADEKGAAAYSAVRLEEAVRWGTEALRIREQLYPPATYPDGHPELAGSIYSLGVLLKARGDYAKAQPLYERSLAMFEKLYPKERFPNGHPDLASSIHTLGLLLKARGDYAKAQPLYERSLAMFEKLYPKERFPNGHPDLARSIGNLGLLLQERADYARAQPLYERSLAMKEKLYPMERFPDGHPDLASSMNNLGSLLQDRGDYARAQHLFERALAMREKLYPKERFPNGHPHLAGSINNLGSLLKARGDYAKAEPLCERSLAMYEKLYPKDRFPNGHPELAASINNLGGLLRAGGDYAKAEPLCERALAMYEKLYPKDRFPNGHPHLALSINNLGLLLKARGDYTGAQTHFERALAMFEKLYPKERFPNGHPDLARSINNLGGQIQARGDYAKAQPLYERAAQMYDRLAAELVRCGSEAEALNFAASLPLARDDYLSLANHLPATHQRDYALLWQSKAALTRVLRRHQGLLHAASLAPEARLRADRLADLRRQRQTVLLAVAGLDQTERDRRLRDLNDEIDTLDRDLLRLVPALRRSDELARRSPDDLGKALPEKSAFIDLLRYAHLDQDIDKPGEAGERRTIEYVGFVVSKEQVQRVELGAAEPIEKVVAAWREAITEGKGKALSPTAQREGEAAVAKQGRRLRELVWDKLAEHLPRDVQTVYLSPDGDLTQVPWAALPGRKPDTVLLEEHAVAVVPHGPFLLDMLIPDPDRPAVDQALLAVGDVRYDDRPASAAVASRGPGDALTAGKLWPNLPGSAREIEQVCTLADKKGWKVQPLTATDAGSAALLKVLPKVRVVHLATHGYFADKKFRSILQLDEKLFEKRWLASGNIGERIGEGARSPLLLSGVVLAGANLPDTPGRGIVTAEALVGLDLSGLDLSVLSACETGLGEVAGGEGVFGLQRAFHLAGTRNVVASLWQVDDDATAALMVLFYRFLWEDKLPPIEALRQAQLEVYRHPDLVRKYAKDLRAPRPSKTVDVKPPDKPEPTPPSDGLKHAPVHRWAAFVLSGAGR